MLDVELIRGIGVMIVTAAAVVLAARKLNVPNIVLYIVAGLILGPHGFDAFGSHGSEAGEGRAAEGLHIVAHLGIVLMLFLVGLELNLDKIRDVGKVAVAAGLGQVVFTAAIGFALSLALGFDAMESIFLATALTFSSTVVVVKLLDQKKHLDRLYGRIAVGIFLVQDMVAILALTFLSGLGSADGAGAGGIAWGTAKAFGGVAVLLGAALLAGRWLLARPMAWIAATAEGALAWSLAWCMTLVALAEALGLSREIGAFLAGLSMAQLPTSGDLRRRVHPLMNFFIAVFFISLGAEMELGASGDNWAPATILSLFVVVGNPFIFLWIIVRCGFSERTSFMTSVTVAQISEFSFVFAALGVQSGLISPAILSLVALVGLATIAVSAYMILYAEKLYDLCRRLGLLAMFRATAPEEAEPSAARDGHVIVVGMNAMGRRLASLLASRGEKVLAIDTDPRKLRGLPCDTVVGSVDHHSLLEEIELERAKLVVSTLRIEDTNNLLAYRCRQAEVPCAVHAFDRSVVEDLRRLGVDFLIDPRAPWQALVTSELDRLDRLDELGRLDPKGGTA